MSLYGVLKFVHVLSVIAWIGGSVAMSIIAGLLLRARDHATLRGFTSQMFAYSRFIGVPSSLIVLVTGIAMVVIGRVGFLTPWVLSGFAGILLHFVVGSTLVQRGIEGVDAIVKAGAVDDSALANANRRLRLGYLVYLAVMVSVIAAMVMKPTL